MQPGTNSHFLKLIRALHSNSSLQIACGHMCTMICHPGAHSSVNDCQEKVVLKCACKTSRKSVLCNQLDKEPDLVEEKPKHGQQQETAKKYLLKCNEKCADRKRLLKEKEDALNAPEKTKNEEQVQVETSKTKYILAAILVLAVSILVYVFLK